MKIQTVKLVSLSEIFGDEDKVKDAFSDATQFHQPLSQFTWGDADHTLIDRDTFLKALANVSNIDGHDAVRSRAESISGKTFIDLEN